MTDVDIVWSVRLENYSHAIGQRNFKQIRFGKWVIFPLIDFGCLMLLKAAIQEHSRSDDWVRR